MSLHLPIGIRAFVRRSNRVRDAILELIIALPGSVYGVYDLCNTQRESNGDIVAGTDTEIQYSIKIDTRFINRPKALGKHDN